MIVPAMLLLTAAACIETDPVTLSFKSDASLDSVAAWASKAFCEPFTVDPSAAKKTLPITVSGTVTRSAARSILQGALASIDVDLRHVNGTVVLGAPVATAGTCDETFADAFRIVSDQERSVSREVFDSDWSACALTNARVVPAFHNGEPGGLKIFAIRPSSLWGAAGFLNGDELLRVNDFPLNSPDQALAAYAKLRSADRLDFLVRRRGAPAHVIITVDAKRTSNAR